MGNNEASVFEVNLSAATRRLVRELPVTAGFVVAFGVAGWIFSQILPDYYRPSSIVVVTNPDLVFRFDPRIETQVNSPPGEGLTEVALSDEIVADLLATGIELGLKASLTTEDFRRDLRVMARGNTLSLQVTCPIAATCAALANRWAELLVNKLNEVYAGAGRDAEAFLQRADAALDTWEEVQDRLTAFQATNEEIALERTLHSRAGALQALLEERVRLHGLLVDARGIRSRIGAQLGGTSPSQEDQVLVMLLALRSLSSTGTPSVAQSPQATTQVQVFTSPDFALQVSAEVASIADVDADVLEEYLDRLITTMEARLAMLDAQESEIQGQLLELQADLSQAVQERTRLDEEAQLSRETYQILARKAVESRLAFDEERVAQIATRAVIPDKRAGPSPELFASLGAILGLLAGTLRAATRADVLD